VKIQNPFRVGLLGGLGVLVAFGIGTAVVSLATILTYIGAALFLALGIDPAVSWLERRRVRRPVAILLVLVAVLLVFAGIVLAIVPVIVDQISLLIAQIPVLISNVSDESFIEDVRERFPQLDVDLVLTETGNFFSNPDNLTEIGGGVLQTGIAISTGTFGAVIILILTLYFVASLASIKRSLYQLVPATKRARFADLTEQISDAVGNYVVGQAGLASINGVLSFILLTFVLQVPYAPLLAVIAFLCSLVPLVGTLTGSTLIILVTVVTSLDEPWKWITALVYYLIYMQVEAYIFTPRIMTRAVSIPGVLVVIAALVGGTLLGVLGALIAIPVAASILLVVRQVLIPKQNEL
jgi:predicted PurR-regulated permease PerM